MKLKEPATTHCIGRYLIDLPASATLVGSTDSYDFAKIHIEEMSHDTFKKEVADFEARLRATKHKKDPSLLLNVTGKAAEMPVFAYWEESYSTVAVDLAGYRWVDGRRYLLRTDADPDKSTAEIEHVSGIVASIQTQTSDMPMEKGFCIPGAIVADEDASDEESTSVSFRLRDKPDVLIEVSTTRNVGNLPETLLSRKPSVLSALRLLGATLGGIHSIREGDRTLSGIEGQEWLVRAPNDHKFQSHLFTWEAQGRADDSMHPQVRIELQTATYGRGIAPGDPSLTDEEAIRLWEQVLSSFRLRPTSPKNNRVMVPPSVPLGTFAAGGSTCPQTGFWRCTESDERVDVSGGRVQYLRAGQTVPQAVLLPLATPWQKLRGEQPTFQSKIPSSWKLVDRRKNPRTAPSTDLAPAGHRQSVASVEKAGTQSDVLDHSLDVSVGAERSSGAVCPTSGWWQCLEPAAFDGARWFANGAVLPPATKPVALTLVEKLKGLPGFVRVAASWQFIRFAHSKTGVSTADETTSETSPCVGKDDSHLSGDA